MKKISFNGIITTISSKVDRSLSLRLSTPEISTEEKALFFELQGINLNVTVEPQEETNLPEYKVDKEIKTKTPGMRLRNTLFVYHKQLNTQEEFETFYKNYLEKIINHIKEKLI